MLVCLVWKGKRQEAKALADQACAMIERPVD
jgi:hypothetical protein